MNPSTQSQSIPVPVWVTLGFYPLYLILWLGLCYWTWKADGLFRIWPYVLLMGISASAVVGLLTLKPHGRLGAIISGGVGLPVVGVALLVVFAIHGGQPEDPPAWFAVLLCLVFVLGGIWHWWALTRPAVRQWSASSQAEALPALEERP